MATKKQTAKQRREAALTEAIENRLRDVLRGAYGPYNESDLEDAMGDEGSPAIIGTEGFARFIGGVRHAFGVTDADGKDYPFNTSALSSWDKPICEIAKWLTGFEFAVQAMKGRV